MIRSAHLARKYARIFVLDHYLFRGRHGGLMVSALDSGASGPGLSPGARFSKAPETFRARKAIAKSPTLRLQSCFVHIVLI